MWALGNGSSVMASEEQSAGLESCHHLRAHGTALTGMMLLVVDMMDPTTILSTSKPGMRAKDHFMSFMCC